MCADRLPGDVGLAILAKAPIPGRAKTRLIPALGPEGAARLHERLLRHTLATALAATPAHLTLWTALDHAHPLFLELAERHGIALRPQPDGDLGERMHLALSQAGGPAMVIGSDCPVLTPALLGACAEALEHHDVVCLPAEDGGYALLGARHSDPRLFENIAWGTGRVMAETRERIAALGWRRACPATVWDVDRPEDLARLSAACPALAKYESGAGIR
ncbi:TIGR04282 family arsenosugar biosynthesis glycosyltransferase [Halomonas mongoliensis]|uniref:TIGR04282 family arsenosugar biosynthesis glycosyltransferase n=1 Tax=Halomonas mongoliensis TaxID=321265 RepID=A0ABU1GH32_9GAMM|nr:TIGR04282 family arsenosugar biosynthesis glycosyltransferase [Halomonas mongoliensis]MDR5891303.1 TIGR04282 family arsenosugar biosynthesis glycosyltransferase [Halomonas mongoliensis]